MRKIELSSWQDIPKRVDNIVRSLEIIYETKLCVDIETISLERLYPTEEFLENDKLALVFMKIIRENYDVPIVVAERGLDYFVLDGHHRSFIHKKLLSKTIEAYIVKFLKGKEYRDVIKHPLEELRMKDISAIEDPILKAWQRILYVAEHYEAIYNMPFYLKREDVCLKNLVPTQSHVGKEQIDAITEVLVPIVCVQSDNEYYILDGHARSLRARALGQESIETMVLMPAKPIDYGIVKTTKVMNLKRLEDVQVVPKTGASQP